MKTDLVSTQDEAEAKRLYVLAAQASGAGGTASDVGQGAVQLIYDSRLLPPDSSQLQGYLTAARAGDPLAQFLLGYLRASAARTSADYRAAAGWLKSAALKGSPAAMANFGILQFEGKGTLQDYVEGYKWLTLAAISGLPGIAEARDRLAARMTPVQINQANDLADAEWTNMSARQ